MDKQKVLSIDEVEDLLTKDSKRLMENLQEEEQGIILQAVANVINRTGMKGKVTLRDGMTDVIHGAGYLLENKNHEVIARINDDGYIDLTDIGKAAATAYTAIQASKEEVNSELPDLTTGDKEILEALEKQREEREGADLEAGISKLEDEGFGVEEPIIDEKAAEPIEIDTDMPVTDEINVEETVVDEKAAEPAETDITKMDVFHQRKEYNRQINMALCDIAETKAEIDKLMDGRELTPEEMEYVEKCEEEIDTLVKNVQDLKAERPGVTAIAGQALRDVGTYALNAARNAIHKLYEGVKNVGETARLTGKTYANLFRDTAGAIHRAILRVEATVQLAQAKIEEACLNIKKGVRNFGLSVTNGVYTGLYDKHLYSEGEIKSLKAEAIGEGAVTDASVKAAYEKYNGTLDKIMDSYQAEYKRAEKLYVEAMVTGGLAKPIENLQKEFMEGTKDLMDKHQTKQDRYQEKIAEFDERIRNTSSKKSSEHKEAPETAKDEVRRDDGER